MQQIYEVIESIDAFVWGPPMIVLLLASHLFLTYKTGGIQRKLFKGIKMSIKKDADGNGDISNFGALCTTLSGTIGTGNIVGVGTAILSGGPGAVLWMWLTGVFGIATKFSEVLVAIKYRRQDNAGNILGGAMVIFNTAFKTKDGKVPAWAKVGGFLFAFFCAMAALGTGCAVQSQAISTIISANVPIIPNFGVGIIIVIITALVIVGGIKSISSVCEKLVPFMAIAYAGGCIIILCLNWDSILPALLLIFESAFNPSAAFGGALGSSIIVVMQFGCARGLFSNESGMGTAPIVASAAKTKNPAEQSLIAMTGTFWSTVVMCALTGIIITSTMIKYPQLVDAIETGKIGAGAELTNAAFSSIPFIGAPLLMLGIVTFAMSTILGWYYYGDRCMAFIFGEKSKRVYQFLYIIAALLGAIGVGDVVWLVSDVANALMTIPNLIAVLLLSSVVARETKYYIWESNLSEVDTEPIPFIDK